MGLDGVELVMSIEEGFGVSIDDAEAEKCFTPAAMIDLVYGKLRACDERICVSQRAFYLLRRGLSKTLGVSRRQVDLDTDIRSFVARRSEPEVWGELKTSVQARSWPTLERPKWVTRCLWVLALGTFCGLSTLVHWGGAAACAIVIAGMASRLTRPLRSRIPPRYSQLRQLVPFAVTSDAILWTRDQVASLVRQLVIEQLGLREGVYREDAYFVKDLGME
jgi:hypothetical protein